MDIDSNNPNLLKFNKLRKKESIDVHNMVLDTLLDGIMNGSYTDNNGPHHKYSLKKFIIKSINCRRASINYTL